MDGSGGGSKALGIEVDNLRAALNWAYSAWAIRKSASNSLRHRQAPGWAMSLLTECREWMRTAISRLDDVKFGGTRQEMVIQSALASCMMFTGGMTNRVPMRPGPKTHLSCRETSRIPNINWSALLVLWAHQVLHPKLSRRRPDWPSTVMLSQSGAAIAAPSQWPTICAESPTTTRGGYWMPKAGLELSLHPSEPRDSLLSSDLATTVSADALGVLVANLVWLRGSPDHAQQLSRNVDRRGTPT